jgi:PAS domain S-box-containing protein
VAAAIRDVTDSRRVEQRFKAVLESAPDAMVGVGADGRIELVNAQAERLFGWSAAQLLGQRIEVLVPSKVGIMHVGHRAGYIDSPTPRPMGAGRQLSARRKDDTTFPADISLSTVTDDRGDLMVLAAVRDVTDRLEFEAERQRQALAAQREQSHRLESLGQLAGGVAHDFNNLLGVILNYTTLIMRQVDEPQLTSDLSEIQAAAERAATLTKQLLTFARRDVARPEPLDVNDVISGITSMLRRTLGEQVSLQLDLAKEPQVVSADRHQLEQIVINLAINARDAMPEGGEIVVVTRREQAADGTGTADVILEVRDDGSGMSREVAARAFEPFFTTKPRGQGTGLGLATVYGIVRQAGGEVTIDSEVDRGTTVRLILPTAGAAPGAASPVVPPPRRGSERILLVEDESALRSGTMRLLIEHGYDVLTAVDGLEALEVFEQSGGVDLIVTDVAMPRMGGVEFADRLAERSSTTPVIFMSGYDSGDAPLTGVLLAKPVAEHDLLRTVREVLDGRG